MKGMFALKLTEVMVDMGTKDIQPEDIHIAECVGQINVSRAFFNSAYGISELDPDDCTQEEFAMIQEAATGQGIPTDKDGAIKFSAEAINQELKAYLKLVENTAKKIKSYADKGIKVLFTLGKKLGVEKNADFKEFVKPLCAAFDSKYPKGIELSKGGFIKAKYSTRMAENYVKGMMNTLAAYGISIDEVVDNNVVSAIVRSNVKSRKDVSDLRDVESNLSTGGKQLSFDKTLTKETHYNSAVKTRDLNAYAMSLYVLLYVSDTIIKKISADGKNALTKIKGLTTECGENKKVGRSCESINDGIKEWTSNLTSITTNISKCIADSAYFAVGALGKGQESK
jgi:hypothetical protein